MPVYAYTAKVKPNTFRSGTVEAESERAAVNKLLLLNYHPITVSPVRKKAQRKISFLKKISDKEIYLFLRQLSNLNLAGLSLVSSLTNLSAQNSSVQLSGIIADLKEKIQKGKSFSEALSEHSDVFNPLEINMIRAAETIGTLPEVIGKIADLKEKDIAFAYRLRSALAYPILLVSVGIIMLFVLTTFVLPRFVSLFQDLGQKLPLATQLLVALSMFSSHYWVLVLGGIGIAVFSSYRYCKTGQGRLWFDRRLLHLPLIRTVERKVQTARFSRTFGNLIENGVPLLSALQIAGDVATNKVFAAEIKHAYTLVSKGQHMHEALKNSMVLERNTLDLIAVGEESGRLEEMLLRIAAMNENEASQQVETIMFMLEPALILILGGIISLIVMAILLPIFQMNFLIQ